MAELGRLSSMTDGSVGANQYSEEALIHITRHQIARVNHAGDRCVWGTVPGGGGARKQRFIMTEMFRGK